MPFPQPPVPEDNLTSYLRRFLEAARRQEAGDSTSTLGSTGPTGTNIEVSRFLLGIDNPVIYYGEYITGSAYPMGAEVTVTSASVYTDGTTNYDCSANTTWVCVSPVPFKPPAGFATNSYVSNYLSITGQQAGICYDPVDSPPDARPAFMVTGSHGTYWKRVGGGGSAGDSFIVFV